MHTNIEATLARSAIKTRPINKILVLKLLLAIKYSKRVNMMIMKLTEYYM